MTRRNTLVGLGVIALSVAVAVVTFPRLPARMAIHWNVAGAPDGYASRPVGLFLLPVLSALLLGFFRLLPRIDPLGENVERFRGYFEGFVVLVLLFLLYVQLLVVAANLLGSFPTNAMYPALGLLLYGAGVLTENAEQNWFVGIRTPWTLSSEEVWDRTHRIGGPLFKLAGVLAVLAVLAGEYAIYVAVIPAVAVALFTTAYSYYLYRQVEGTGGEA